jgi:hypothetical protein
MALERKENPMEARKLVTLSGAAIVVLIALTVAVLGPNSTGNGETGAKIATFYTDHHARAVAQALVLALTAPLLVTFGAVLVGARRRPDAASHSAAELVLAGGSVIAAGAFLLNAAVQFALADVPDKLSGGALQALNVLCNDLWVAWNPALGVMMLGAAATLRGRGGSLHVLGTIATVLGIALFIPFADFFALLATGVWLIAASVVLYRDAAGPSYAARPQTA